MAGIVCGRLKGRSFWPAYAALVMMAGLGLFARVALEDFRKMLRVAALQASAWRFGNKPRVKTHALRQNQRTKQH